MENSSYDIVIIGKGVSGLSAAIGAIDKFAKVLVVSDSNISSTVLAEKGVFRLSKDRDAMYNRIMKYGDGIAKNDIVGIFVDLLKNAEERLEKVFSMSEAKHVGIQVEGGGPRVSMELEWIAKKKGVDFISGKVIKIAVADNRVSAVQVIWHTQLMTIRTKAVIIACGGIGSVYSKTDNSREISIPGCSLALDAGAKLRDMEFIIFHPFSCNSRVTIFNTKPIYTFFDVKKTKLFSSTGERLHTIESLINSGEAHKLINEITKSMWKFNTVHFFKDNEEIILEPAQHSLIGGIDTDTSLMTCVDGLYAVGESMGGLNGANRMAGMSMAEGFLMGTKAGESAANYSSKKPLNELDEENLISSSLKCGFISRNIVNRIHDLADTTLFIEREEKSLLYCEEQLYKIMNEIKLSTLSGQIEMGIAMTAMAIVKASLLRKECRGAYYRSDYLECDPKYECSIEITYRDGVFRQELSYPEHCKIG